MDSKKNARTLRFTDSLLISDHPGGEFESALALDIFNDPRSWDSDTSMVEEQSFMMGSEPEKRRSLTRIGSEKMLRRPKPEEVVLRPFTHVHSPKLNIRPRRASISSASSPETEMAEKGSSNNFQHLVKVLEPKSTGLTIDLKRVSSLWANGNLFRAFPSPLDAPISAARPFTPLSASKKLTLATPTSSVGLMSAALSATWDVFRGFTSPRSPFNPLKSAGLSATPRSARLRPTFTVPRTPAVPALPRQLQPAPLTATTPSRKELPLPPQPQKKAVRPLPAIPLVPKTPSLASAVLPKTPRTAQTPTVRPLPKALEIPLVIPNPPAYSPVDPVLGIKSTKPLQVAPKSGRRTPGGGLPTSALLARFPVPPALPPPNIPLPPTPMLMRSNTIKEAKVTNAPRLAPRAQSELHRRRRNTPYYLKGGPPVPELVPF